MNRFINNVLRVLSREVCAHARNAARVQQTHPRHPHIHSAGFSLIEVLLSVALISIIMAFALPVHQTFQSRVDRNVAATIAAQSVRQAQANARGIMHDDNWGVAFTAGDIVVFKGASYAARDSAFDESYTLPSTVSVSGTTEYVFDKATGSPQSTGATSFSGNAGTSTITVNTLGMIEY